MPYIPHTPKDKQEMLATIGVHSTQELFDEIPSSLLCSEFQGIPLGLPEMDMLREAQMLAQKNVNGTCFIGAGAYEHHIPAAVWDLATRGEYLTAYTPYQAEASQGTLQLLYEFQTMMCELTGMDVANASMYDGATALAEAALMAVRLNKHSKSNRILVAGTLHPFYRDTLNTILGTQHIELVTLPFDIQEGRTVLSTLEGYQNEDITALIIQQPNFFGCLELVDELCNWAKKQQIMSIACVNPISLALLNPPGLWGEHGVDIVCGEGQPLGVPLASGGPYFGFLCTRMEHVRQMPGRIIGCTVDKEGKRGFTLTLQAREQHIRRAKATSNICTNQGLLVTAAAIYMSLLGADGLKRVAQQCFFNTHELLQQLTQIPGVKQAVSAPFFHEVLIQIPQNTTHVLAQLATAGIAGGYEITPHYSQYQNSMLVCATEMRTQAEITHFAATLGAILHRGD